MSIERNDGEIEFFCDGKGCNDSVDTGTSDFEEAREILKDEGWYTTKIDGEWCHFCPDCWEHV